MNYSQSVRFTDLAEAEMFVAAIPAMAQRFINSHPEVTPDGSIESLDRVWELMLSEKEKEGFDHHAFEFIRECFGYVAVVYELNVWPFKVTIDREHFKANKERTTPVLARLGTGSNVPVAMSVIQMLHRTEVTPANRLRACIAETEQLTEAPVKRPGIRSQGSTATLLVDSPNGFALVAAAVSSSFNSVTAGVGRILIDIEDWRLELEASSDIDPEMVADVTSGTIKHNGTMPANVQAVWIIRAEADPELEHFNDFAVAINCVEEAYTAAAHLIAGV